MVLFRHRSIRRDLMVIIMSVSVLSVLLTSFAISFIHYTNYQDTLLRDIGISADIISERIRPLLSYEEVPTIKRRIFTELGHYTANPTIRRLCVYGTQSQLLAFYDAENKQITDMAESADVNQKQFLAAAQTALSSEASSCPRQPAMADSIIRAHHNHVAITRILSTALPNNSGDVGLVYVSATLDAADNQFSGQALTTLIACVGALLISYLLAVKLQQSISEPISKLSQVTRNVIVYKDYSLRVANSKAKYSDDVGQLIESFNAMLKDIGDRDSKLQRKNLELERAKEMAESANLSKSQFLANISHELRTPLNAIIGFSSIIINQLFGPVGNDRYVSYAKDINDSGIHLLDIINDILDLSKAEAGKLSLRLEEINVHEALKKCVQIVAERASEAEVAISMDVPATMPKLVADRVRFIQIILNLLSNAVKFTEAGGRIDIQAEVEAAGNEVHYFTFRVKDTGIGMRKEDIDMAFQTFGQVDSGLNRRYEGTGLGLPLTKKLVELHNGSIRIDSALHKGTTVAIRLISDRALL